MMVAAMIALQIAAAQAGDEASSFDPRDNMRGAFVLKFPFGVGESFSSARVGLDVRMEQKSDLDYLRERYDPETGRYRSEVDTDSVRTWSLDGLEFTLPDHLQGKQASQQSAR